MSIAISFPAVLRTACAALAATFASSCLNVEQKLALNPDGSGKITITTAIAMPDLGALAGGLGGNNDEAEKPKPKEQARELVVALLRAEGIEAWTDVSYGVAKDGKTTATATGYFPDATKVRLSKPMNDGGEAEPLGVTKNKEGHWVIMPSIGDDKKSDQAASTDEAKAETLTDEEVQDRLDQERQQWAGAKIFIGAFLDGLRMAYSVEAGGTITEASMFQKQGDSKASFEFTGKQLLESVDKLLQDDEAAKKLIRKGVSPTDSGPGGSEEMFKTVFGGDGQLRLVIKPGQPVFDYKAEVAKAKASATPELKQLLADAAKPAKKKGGLFSLPGSGGDAEPDEEPAPAEEEPAPKKKPAKID